jgi:TPR repeat protein
MRAGLDVDALRRGAEQGDAVAQLNLGERYATGKGTPRDEVKAHAWFSLAAAQGEALAGRRKALVAVHLSAGQQAKAQALSEELQGQIDRYRKQNAAPHFWPAVEGPTVVGKTELRAWLQGIKPAAGGKQEYKSGL